MTEKTTKPRITLDIKNMKFVATWKYNAENDICLLCKEDLTLGTFNKQITNNNVKIGDCHHGFHERCINVWLKEGNISCPGCKTSWERSNTVSSGVYIYKTTT